MEVFEKLAEITRPSYEPPEDHELKSVNMFEEIDQSEELLKFVQWINAKNVVHVGTDMWKIGSDHINDKELIERYLET